MHDDTSATQGHHWQFTKVLSSMFNTKMLDLRARSAHKAQTSRQLQHLTTKPWRLQGETAADGHRAPCLCKGVY